MFNPNLPNYFDLFSYNPEKDVSSSLGMTMPLSPISAGLAYADWLMHIQRSPKETIEFWKQFIKAYSFPETEEPANSDHRFKDKAWNFFPYNFYKNNFLAVNNFWANATNNVDGVSQHHKDLIHFYNQQVIDAFAPSNFINTNPAVQKKVAETFGLCLLEGFSHFIEDVTELNAGEIPEHLHPFKTGKDVALTPGKVIYQNRLIELIQYSPSTKKVYAEPILIVPAWIMKYYILDLTPGESLVEYLVQQGHTVFLISWKNPTKEDRDIGFNDYMKLGILESVDVINALMPNKKIHAAGYCIGGILLTLATAWLSHLKKDVFQSVSLLASQVDFDEAGLLSLFTDSSQLSFVERRMNQSGYLDKIFLKAVFQFLHAKDLLWPYIIQNYLLGERPDVSPLMAWSSDATRMPYRMHKEYLERFYLNDELAEGHYQIDGEEIALSDIHQPIYCLATEKDYLSPWQSVYKLHLFTHTDITFVLTNGGHNAGIVSRLNHPRRHYRESTTRKNDAYISAKAWLKKNNKPKSGSWWPSWHQWLVNRSDSSKVTPPPMGNKQYQALCDAPGTYVKQP